MKKFSFSLQSVLRLKENIEEYEKTVLCALETKKSALQSELGRLDALYKGASNELKALICSGTSSGNISEYTHYMHDLDKKKAAKQKEIDDVQLQIEKQTQVLLQIRTEIKSLDKLKENQYKSYNFAQNKQNDILIEDFVAGRRLMV